MTHTEMVDCPVCGEPIVVELEWDAGEAPSRDCPGYPGQWSVLDYAPTSRCLVSHLMTHAQYDAIDAEAKARAEDTRREALAR